MNKFWIKVQDKLPKKGEIVLVCLINKAKEKHIELAHLDYVNFDYPKDGLRWYSIDGFALEDVEVTHWMPITLPEN